jgi:NADH-quinone oxidoreductase subunit F
MPAFEDALNPSPSPFPFSPEEILDRVAAAGLRGRGGGWFPAARKWRAVRGEGGEPMVVANGAEGEPGSIKDRYVMLTRPAEVVRGLALAAHAVGAREAVIFLKRSFEGPARALARAVEEGAGAGLDITVQRGDDSYIAGEETAVLEVLEGRRAWPRPKPPLPCAVGFRGRPTLVQNVETLARVPSAVADPAGFRERAETLVSIWGHVRRPGVYEARLGTPLSQLIDEKAGGAPEGIGWLFPAGPSAAPLPPAAVQLPLDPDALRAAGSGLGTAALLVVRPGTCPLALAASLAAFFERESCGQCPPCTMGTASLARVVGGLETGQTRASQVTGLRDVAGFMGAHGYCAHSRTAAAAVMGLLGSARADVEAHLEAGRCPHPGGGSDPFGPTSPERAAIEAALAESAP